MSRRYKAILDGLRLDRTSFPEIHAVGEMRPISQTIHLHQATRTALKDLRERRINTSEVRHHAETYMHECMHWYDLVGTLWGVRFLDLIYECLDIRESRPNTAETDLYKVVELYDEERRIIAPYYYHLVLEEKFQHSIRRPWRIQFSCGLEFDAYGRLNLARPLFFVRFSDHDSDELIARQPLTVGALLETKAIASELHTAIEIIADGAESEAEFRTGLMIYSREKSSMLYDRNLTVYTAPAHLLSRFVGTKEPTLTYDYAAALANVVLNMTGTHFSSLKHPDTFSRFGEERLEAFRASQNHGYAFAAIVAHANQHDPGVSLDQWLDTTIQRAGLPPRLQFFNDTWGALTARKVPTLEVDNLREARQELEHAGRHYFKNMTVNGKHWIAGSSVYQHNLPLPYAFDEDGNLFCLGSSLNLKDFHPELQFEREWELIKFRDNFLGGSRGVRLTGGR